MNLIPVNWQPKVFGWLGFISVASTQLLTLNDNDPATNPDVALIWASLSLALGLNFARQANKRSEDQK